MKVIMTTLFFAAFSIMSAQSVFAKTTTHAKSVTEPFRLIHAQELDKLMQAHPKNLYIYDANNEKTRKMYGTIPTAELLSSPETYDVAKVLPKDKSAELVFYCANEMCMSSHDAAKKAAHAGYKNVNVMADGIQGWSKAGFAINK